MAARGATKTHERATATGPMPTLPPLIPPFRHSMVEEGVYRGAHPSLKNLRFLRRLNLSSIVSLVADPTGPPRDLCDYCAGEHIRHTWHQVDKYDERFSHTPALVATVLNELIDPRNHPTYLHCRDGGHNTGLIVMCLRRLQNWSLPAIYHEFRRYTKSNELSFAERQFVESFQETVSVPVSIPRWLWDGVRHRRHPSIRVRLERDPGTPVSMQSPSPSVPRELDVLSSGTAPSATTTSPLPPAPPPAPVSVPTPTPMTMTSAGLTPLNDAEPLAVARARARCTHVHMRYSDALAALDLHGVHLRRYRARARGAAGGPVAVRAGRSLCGRGREGVSWRSGGANDERPRLRDQGEREREGSGREGCG